VTIVANSEPVDILVVEDNDSQRASIVLVLQKRIPDAVVIATRDEPEALDLPFNHGAWTYRVGEDPPRLILLDVARGPLAELDKASSVAAAKQGHVL